MIETLIAARDATYNRPAMMSLNMLIEFGDAFRRLPGVGGGERDSVRSVIPLAGDSHARRWPIAGNDMVGGRPT